MQTNHYKTKFQTTVMKKLLFLICLSALFLAACQKTVDQPEIKNSTVNQQELPFCGMEQAMANMLPEYRNAMYRTETTTPATELLLVSIR